MMYLVDQSKTFRTNIFAKKNIVNPKTSVLHVSCYYMIYFLKFNSTVAVNSSKWHMHLQHTLIRCALHIDAHITVHITVHIAVPADLRFSYYVLFKIMAIGKQEPHLYIKIYIYIYIYILGGIQSWQSSIVCLIVKGD